MQDSRMIFPPVKDALVDLVNTYGSRNKEINSELIQRIVSELTVVFSDLNTFLQKVRALEVVVKAYPQIAELEEYLFDLLMINFLTSKNQVPDEDYFESTEWIEIEDKTLDRGTELLNLLLYINEAVDAGIEPELTDFLDEFLLTNDDLYQDELFIYEPFMKHQYLSSSYLEDIVEASKKINTPELQELFIPSFLFFNTRLRGKEKEEKIAKLEGLSPLDLSLYACVKSFHQSLSKEQ